MDKPANRPGSLVMQARDRMTEQLMAASAIRVVRLLTSSQAGQLEQHGKLMRIFKITDIKAARPAITAVWETVKAAIVGGSVEVIIQRPSKSRDQERKYHAMIRDIQQSVDLDGKRFDFDVWKALLVQAFEKEMREQGTPLSHPGRVVPSLDGMDVVTVRASTRRFRVAEASQFIEWLYAWGAEHSARFSDESLWDYQELAERVAA